MKKAVRIGAVLAVLLGSFSVVYAATRLFFTKSITSDIRKKKIFTMELSASWETVEIGPGETFSVKPTVENTSTEQMYVFIEVEMPTINGRSLYEFTVNENWTLLDDKPGYQVYGYGVEESQILVPGEKTKELTTEMHMINVTNTEFSEISDINVIITGVGIDIIGDSSDMTSVWEEYTSLR